MPSKSECIVFFHTDRFKIYNKNNFQDILNTTLPTNINNLYNPVLSQARKFILTTANSFPWLINIFKLYINTPVHYSAIKMKKAAG